MSVGSHSAHEEIDASSVPYGFLVVVAFLYKVVGIAVEDMHVLGFYVYMGEKVVPHEGVIGLWMVLVEIDILVHIERYDIGERQFSCFVLLYQLLI